MRKSESGNVVELLAASRGYHLLLIDEAGTLIDAIDIDATLARDVAMLFSQTKPPGLLSAG